MGAFGAVEDDVAGLTAPFQLARHFLTRPVVSDKWTTVARAGVRCGAQGCHKTDVFTNVARRRVAVL
jgi:hypothetical protein